MQLGKILQVLEDIAPSSLQESYDNSGLQIGSPGQSVNRGLICLDATPAVMQEAIDKQCDLVLCHHPLIFKGVKKITGEQATDKVLIEAIRHGIAVVSVHTNLDNTLMGVNHALASELGLTQVKILKVAEGLLKKLVVFCPLEHADKLRAAIFAAGAGQIGNYDCCSFNTEGRGSFRAGDGASPFTGKLNELHYEPEVRVETIFPAYLQKSILTAMFANHPYEEVAYDIYPLDNAFDKAGAGMIGDLDSPLPVDDFLQHVKLTLSAALLRHSHTQKEQIKKVAVCGGSGSFLIQEAIRAGADAFITADVKYHQFHEAEQRILLIDAGHYETEQFAKELLLNGIKKKLTNFALLISEADTNPVRYF
ncbi:MAG: Nif3-like dinuclear metal center hexameric protein [Bacteroidales bacterium]|nr:Nif3-like dinuclear metal center hexameric protein [Bacteroidales bacterium]